jgi:hypothetical protein
MNAPWTHDREHVRLLQNAHADYIESQYRGMERMPGNPMGVVMRQIGPTRTFIARGNRLENRAIFTGEESDEQIAQVLRHFIDHQSNCVIEVNPANFYVNPPATWEKRLLKRLLALGCAIHDFRCVWSTTVAPSTIPTSHRCESFGPERIDAYIELAREVDPKVDWSADRIAAMSEPGWRHYVLFDDAGVPCSNGSLFAQGEAAYLAWWYTAPPFRGRGMQREGITHRLRDAFDSGCQRAFTVTDFNFASPANLQRCGFSLAYNYLLLRRDPTPLA